MGTRADFYVGRGKTAEWVGSIAWDGYPEDKDLHPLFRTTDEASFRAAIADLAKSRDDFTLPKDGWPWAWTDSHTTDFAYAFDGGVVWGSGFGDGWWPAASPPKNSEGTDNTVEGNTVEFPDMTAKQNVTFGSRSGILIF